MHALQFCVLVLESKLLSSLLTQQKSSSTIKITLLLPVSVIHQSAPNFHIYYCTIHFSTWLLISINFLLRSSRVDTSIKDIYYPNTPFTFEPLSHLLILFNFKLFH